MIKHKNAIEIPNRLDMQTLLPLRAYDLFQDFPDHFFHPKLLSERNIPNHLCH